ncbi:MAG: enolase C-terminal domain-like protein [Terriglobia bacterium]|jgi:L-alanine-DL-glutamate epimerase-like enolase superfamily enzyme
MNRRKFLQAGTLLSMGTIGASGIPEKGESAPLPSPPPLPFNGEKSDLKITSVRMVHPKPKRPLPQYEPAPGSWSTGGSEVANPMSIYPKYKAQRSLFMANDLGPEAVEISTDKGIKGIGFGGPGCSFVIDKHLTKLLMGEDPFNIEELWDIMWRSTLYYGRKGLVVNAISAVDLALWDIIGNALGMPIYKLLGGETKSRIPAYCTGNDIEQHIEFGYKRLKLAVPYGPADGREGMKKNTELVKKTRESLGPDGDLMLDCWMALTEEYSIEFAAMVEPYSVYWMEECLPPDDYEGFGRIHARIKSCQMAAGEHEYTRYGFRLLLEHKALDIWQPDITWRGGLSELRHIGALAAAYNIPVIPHAGWQHGGWQFILATTNSPWCEMFLPPLGGPPEVYQRFEEENGVTRGPEGIYMRPPDRPGFGWDLTVD